MAVGVAATVAFNRHKARELSVADEVLSCVSTVSLADDKRRFADENEEVAEHVVTFAGSPWWFQAGIPLMVVFDGVFSKLRGVRRRNRSTEARRGRRASIRSQGAASSRTLRKF